MFGSSRFSEIRWGATAAVYVLATVDISTSASISASAVYTASGAVQITATPSVIANGGAIYVVEADIQTSVSLTALPTRIIIAAVDISGSVTIALLSELTTPQEVLVYAGTLAVGDTLVIDTDKMTVKLNGTDVRYDISGTFWKLAPGDNEIEYQDSEAARTVALTVEHTPRDV